MRTLSILAVILVAACSGPAAASPTPTSAATNSPAPTTTVSPALTASAAPVASATPIVLPTSAQVAAAGNGVVWALVADSHLFRSLDRGQTWEERGLPPPRPFTSIAFTSDRDGWILSAGSAASLCQGQLVNLYRTSDGAGSWQAVPTRGLADAQCKGALAFNDTKHGYMSAGDEFNPPLIYATADGGATWTGSQPLADPPGFTTTAAGGALRAGPVADFVAVMFVDATGYIGGRQVDYVFRSTDRGATWSYVTTASQGVPVVFITTTHWIQLVSGDQSRETTDAGRSWHAAAPDYSQSAPVAAQVVFGDLNTGYATARGFINRTIDSGAHWTSLKTPGT